MIINSKNKKNKIILLSFITIFMLFLISINLGSIKVELKELIVGLLSNTDDPKISIIRDIRIPRVLAAIIIGANLAVSGVLLQAIIRNPLAEPSIVGISSGASLISVVILLFFPSLNSIRPFFGFFGGLVSCILVCGLAFKKGLSPIRIVLAGVAVNAMLSAITNITVQFGAGAVSSVQSWLTGSLANITWIDIKLLLIYSIIGHIGAFLLYKSCDLIALGEKNAKSLGLNYDLHMSLICVVAVFLSATATSIGGVIAFVGLVVPHICRIIMGSSHRYLIPFSISMGGILLLLADTLGRMAFSPLEIPVGIVMAVTGGPVFLYLLRRSEV